MDFKVIKFVSKQESIMYSAKQTPVKLSPPPPRTYDHTITSIQEFGLDILGMVVFISL